MKLCLCLWASVATFLQNAFTEMYYNFIGDSNHTISWPLLYDMVTFSTGASVTYARQISINILIVSDITEWLYVRIRTNSLCRPPRLFVRTYFSRDRVTVRLKLTTRRLNMRILRRLACKAVYKERCSAYIFPAL